MNKFLKAEQDGRTKFKKFYYKYLKHKGYDIVFSNDRYSNYDAKLISKTKTILVEIKNRNDYYLTYDDVFAESLKINNLKNLAKENDYSLLYFNCYTNSNKVRLINPLTNDDFINKRYLCNKQTVLSNGKKYKECIIYKKYNELEI